MVVEKESRTKKNKLAQMENGVKEYQWEWNKCSGSREGNRNKNGG